MQTTTTTDATTATTATSGAPTPTERVIGRAYLGGPVMRTLRDSHDPGDEYGWCVLSHFAICDVLQAMGEDIPATWDYSPGAAQPATLEELYAGEDFTASELSSGVSNGWWTADDLRHAGTVLSRFAAQLRLAGLDY